MRAIKIVFVNRYFYPDHSATSQLLSDLAFALADDGVSVEVVTSRQRYGAADAGLPQSKRVRNVDIRRVWTSRFGRDGLFGRSLDYLTFHATAWFALMRCVGSGDVIVAMTDPPLISVVAAMVAWYRGASLINWTQDLFPDVATALGVPGISWLSPSLRYMRNVSFRRASTNVVLGERMAQKLVAEGVPQQKIRVIQNWSDEDIIEPIPTASNPLRDDWGLAAHFVVGYGGNMGRAHEFGTMLDAASLLRSRDDIRFLFIGEGAQKAAIVKEVGVRELKNVEFKPYQARKDLGHSLNVIDLHVISLKPSLEGLIVPSKFYGVAAAGRPTLFIGDPEGEVAKLLRDGGCGYAIQPGEARAVADLIEQLATDPEKLCRLGRRAREFFEHALSKKRALNEWRQLLGTTRR